MVDQNITYLSESAVYRILDSENLLCRRASPRRSSGNAPLPPTAPHQRWHTDIMHLRLADTWYFLVSFIDAYSRYIVHWRLLPNMTAAEVSLAQLEALEKYQGVKPEIVSDHGSQYTSREYRKLLKRFELKHILCRIAHPQSNGVIERYHRSTREALQENQPANFIEAKDIISTWVEDYNEQRLHAGLKYIEPAEYFRGNPGQRINERKEKLKHGKQKRRQMNLAGKKQNTIFVDKSELPTGGNAAPTSMLPHSRRAAAYG